MNEFFILDKLFIIIWIKSRIKNINSTLWLNSKRLILTRLKQKVYY